MSDSLVNKTHMKKFILEKCKQLRSGHAFTRVSQQAIDEAEAYLRNWIVQRIEKLPSVGTTVKFIGWQ